MKLVRTAFFVLFTGLVASAAFGQKYNKIIPEKCGTMQNLELQYRGNPAFKAKFEAERRRFNDAMKQGAHRVAGDGNRTYVNIPVVFHVVLTNQLQVTDAQLQAQLDTINKDYAGLNGDSVVIPSYFKPLFGKSQIQFCLARQTPSGDPTSGIERITTAKTSFLNTDNGVKHASSGGADAWDPSSYLNVWVCPLSNGLLGYATFPQQDVDTDQGVVIEYRSIPGSTAYPQYSGGKTLTHEIGHYFNLYHIWGDDNGACTGTDYVEDTPNQGNSSNACGSGIVTDACTPAGNGIMYQNYMDYTYDQCLVLFTVQQVSRMESALFTYRSSLLNSIGCQAPVVYNLDAQLRSVNQPSQRICNNVFSPDIILANRGSQTLTSVTITTLVDNVVKNTYTWTGSLAMAASVDVVLPPVTTTAGTHVLTITLSKPNSGTDQNTGNDALSRTFQYNDPVTAVQESFEGSLFPPTGWDIVNPDRSITWQRVTGIAKTGNASVMIDNADYSTIGQQDYLRLPDVSLAGVDSAFFSFQVAAATYTPVATAGNTWDTLEVLISKDCGQTYTSLYKKWGATLVTHTAADSAAFVPSASEWRKDSINISNYIGAGKVLLAFRNTTGFENNIYIDDVNLRTVTINPNLKSRGFLVTPSPTNGPVVIQFYPQPTNIKSLQIFNLAGQKVAEAIPQGQSNYYQLNISRNAPGIYVVRVVMGNEVITKKIVKF